MTQAVPPGGPAAWATFGADSQGYAAARPTYPQELFEWMASRCVRREAAWDCATGNGQAAVGLSSHFGRIYATDRSDEQIAHAVARRNIVYSVQPAERTALADESFDLISVAQALHWFDLPAFWREAHRVARPGALFAAWGYNWAETTGDIETLLMQPFRKLVAPFWAPNNKLLWNGYRDVGFPFQRIDTPNFAMHMEWHLDQILAYLKTWSAYRISLAEPKVAAAVQELMEQATRTFASDQVFSLRTPLVLLAGHIV